MNPKLLISEYFDSLINRVDIHIEERLAKFSSQKTMKDPHDTNDEPRTVLVWDHLNETREKMIKKISEAQLEALKKLEAIKNDIKPDDSAETIFEKVFADRFLFIIQIDDFSFYDAKIVKSPFKLYLVDSYFYLKEENMVILM